MSECSSPRFLLQLSTHRQSDEFLDDGDGVEAEREVESALLRKPETEVKREKLAARVSFRV